MKLIQVVLLVCGSISMINANPFKNKTITTKGSNCPALAFSNVEGSNTTVYDCDEGPDTVTFSGMYNEGTFMINSYNGCPKTLTFSGIHSSGPIIINCHDNNKASNACPLTITFSGMYNTSPIMINCDCNKTSGTNLKCCPIVTEAEMHNTGPISINCQE